MWIEHSKSQPVDDKPSLKWAWSRHVIQFKFQSPNHISGITEARIVKFLTRVGYIKCYQKDDISPPKWAWCGHVTVFKFCRLPWRSASRGFVRISWYLQLTAGETYKNRNSRLFCVLEKY